ncbi:uncharacterized protein [Amphiura filiformis]|uniref:uncharacterized protein isoform X2 n=1 Tax=Amphiura filiformis TaxID=82378 RepID=UPI003B21AB66
MEAEENREIMERSKDSANGSLNGNGSYKQDEEVEEILSPRFSRPKVPEVTLNSDHHAQNNVDQYGNSRSYKNGYRGNGYHNEEENGHSKEEFYSDDEVVNGEEEEEEENGYHGNGVYEDDYEEDYESDREQEHKGPLTLEPNPFERGSTRLSLRRTSPSQIVKDHHQEEDNELTPEGKEQLLKLRKTPRANSVNQQEEVDKEVYEAELKAAELREKRAREEEERWREEEEHRKAERDQYERDLVALQEKAERRKRQKEEEEQKRQQEEEERKAREAEEAQKRKEEIERRRQEAGERLRSMMNGNSKNPMHPKYNITAAIAKAREDRKKSDDEMKNERERVVQERVPALDIGLNISMERLKEIAQDLHKKLLEVYAARFDMEQRKKRQDYDLHEMSERIKDLTKPSSNKTQLTSVVIDSGIVSKIKEQGFLTESKPKKKSFYQERNESIANSGGVAGRLSLFQSKINNGDKPEIRKSGSPRSWKNPEVDKCCMCNKNVYSMEKLEVNKKVYHQHCFKCAFCNKILSLSHYSLYAGNVYCKPHQRKVEWEDLQAGVKTPVKKGVNNNVVQSEEAVEA